MCHLSNHINSNNYYRAINVVGFFADSTPLLERYVGFWVAYLVPCCCMWLALIPIFLGRNYFGQFIHSPACYMFRLANMCLVRASPTSNIMPEVMAALRCGMAGGFRMDAAKPDAQLQHGRRVSWTGSFIEDIKRSLLTCRVLYVQLTPPNSLPSHRLTYVLGFFSPFTGSATTRHSTI